MSAALQAQLWGGREVKSGLKPPVPVSPDCTRSAIAALSRGLRIDQLHVVSPRSCTKAPRPSSHCTLRASSCFTENRRHVQIKAGPRGRLENARYCIENTCLIIYLSALQHSPSTKQKKENKTSKCMDTHIHICMYICVRTVMTTIAHTLCSYIHRFENQL